MNNLIYKHKDERGNFWVIIHKGLTPESPVQERIEAGRDEITALRTLSLVRREICAASGTWIDEADKCNDTRKGMGVSRYEGY